jgi:hypothetical protein
MNYGYCVIDEISYIVLRINTLYGCEFLMINDFSGSYYG